MAQDIAVGSKLLDAGPLTGGISAQMIALRMETLMGRSIA